MTQQEMIDGDLIIAIFDKNIKAATKDGEYVIDDSKNNIRYFNYETEFNYHDDWNKLMSVIEKIGKSYYKGFPINITIGTTGMYIGVNETNASSGKFEGRREIANTLNINYSANSPEEETPWIESIWIAVVQFIKWYNEQTK